MYGEGSNERKTLNVSKGDTLHVALRGYESNSAAMLLVRQL